MGPISTRRLAFIARPMAEMSPAIIPFSFDTA
jgi:hypothetical protein